MSICILDVPESSAESSLQAAWCMQVTFNSLIAACAQGAQWEKAAELFEQMHGRGCRPDPVTYGGLISAYERVSPQQLQSSRGLLRLR